MDHESTISSLVTVDQESTISSYLDHEVCESDPLLKSPEKAGPKHSVWTVALGYVALTVVMIASFMVFSKNLSTSSPSSDASSTSASSSNKLSKSDYETVAPLNGRWILDKYTVSTTAGAHDEVKDFMNSYITASPGFAYFGCSQTNDTVKLISYVGGNCDEIHFVDSDTFPDITERPVGYWANYIADLSTDSFHAFMHNKVQLFVPDLSGHYDKIVTEGGFDVMLRLSSSAGSSTTDIAHISLQIKHTGTFIDLVGPSDTLSDSALSSFSSWTDDECASAHELPKSLTTYQTAYDSATFSDSSDSWTNSTGLYTPIIASMAVASGSTAYISDTISIYTDLLDITVDTQNSSTGCVVYTVDLSSTTDDDDYVSEITPTLRYVVNPVAPEITAVSDWEDDVATTHSTYLDSSGTKWDRYLDSHIGLFNDEYRNDDSNCLPEVDAIESKMDALGVLKGNRQSEGSAHIYAGVKGLMSLEFNVGCSSVNYTDVCGCIAENNYDLYLEQTGEACYGY